MSYAYDVGSRALAAIEDGTASDEVRTLFRLLFEAMHEANHRLKDGINSDLAVRSRAGRLDRALDRP